MKDEKNPNQDIVNNTLTYLNNNPNGLDVNSSILHLIGTGDEENDAFASTKGGVRDVFNPKSDKSDQIDRHTMLPEASIGKVRYAGLAYMLEQDKVLDMNTKVKELFETKEFAQFLDEKYGENREGFENNRKENESFGVGMQREILKSFTGDSVDSTLADLTTHYAGVGDLTSEHFGQTFKTFGLEHSYDFPTLLKPPGEPIVKRDDNGKPYHCFSGQPGKYGEHQYSNLGYMMLAEAMEYCFDQKVKAEEQKPLGEGKKATYQDLMNAYMLHPTRGYAKGKNIDFNETKFPEDVDKENDNVVSVQYLDLKEEKNKDKKLVQVNDFSGAHAAGGIFTSPNDSAKFFSNFFKGFPGTKEYGQEEVNPFFSKDTIEKIMNETMKRGPAGESEDQYKNPRFQGPGFTIEFEKEFKNKELENKTFDQKDWTNCKIKLYDKNGDTCGASSYMMYNPEKNTVDISMMTRENLTGTCAQSINLETLPKQVEELCNYMVSDKVPDKKALCETINKILNIEEENKMFTPENLKASPKLLTEAIQSNYNRADPLTAFLQNIKGEMKEDYPLKDYTVDTMSSQKLMGTYKNDRQALLNDYKENGVEGVKNKVKQEGKEEGKQEGKEGEKGVEGVKNKVKQEGKEGITFSNELSEIQKNLKNQGVSTVEDISPNAIKSPNVSPSNKQPGKNESIDRN